MGTTMDPLGNWLGTGGPGSGLGNFGGSLESYDPGAMLFGLLSQLLPYRSDSDISIC